MRQSTNEAPRNQIFLFPRSRTVTEQNKPGSAAREPTPNLALRMGDIQPTDRPPPSAIHSGQYLNAPRPSPGSGRRIFPEPIFASRSAGSGSSSVLKMQGEKYYGHLPLTAQAAWTSPEPHVRNVIPNLAPEPDRANYATGVSMESILPGGEVGQEDGDLQIRMTARNPPPFPDTWVTFRRV
jgi:hypothetical protein